MPHRHRGHRDKCRERIAFAFSVLSVSLWPMIWALAESTTKPSDPALDWMLAHPTTSPTTAPTTATSPLVSDVKDEWRNGTITLSDGTKLTGQISTTIDKPLRVYDESEKQYIDVPFDK